jgi:hypothetical protein
VYLWRDGTPLVLVGSYSGVLTNAVAVTTPLEDGVDHYWRVDIVTSVSLIPGTGNWLFTTRPLPDLRATGVTAPTTVITGASISISWTVENRGRGGPFTTSWQDRVYLSEQRILDLTAQPPPIVVGTYTNPSYLDGSSNPNDIPAFYTRSATYNVPLTATANSYYAIVVVDLQRVTGDKDYSNNVDGTSQRIDVVESPVPDLNPVRIVLPEDSFSGEVRAAL